MENDRAEEAGSNVYKDGAGRVSSLVIRIYLPFSFSFRSRENFTTDRLLGKTHLLDLSLSRLLYGTSAILGKRGRVKIDETRIVVVAADL